MIYTSSYKDYGNRKSKTYSLSLDFGVKAKYVGDYVPFLLPGISLVNKWNRTKGVIKEEDNNKLYVFEYYRTVLMRLDPEEVYNKLNNSVLLCYEDSSCFCHRHIVAEWLELFLDKEVKEINVSGGYISFVNRPDYIKSYLEEAIRKYNDILGFASLRVFYLFSKSEEYRLRSMDEIYSADEQNVYKVMADEYRYNECSL